MKKKFFENGSTHLVVFQLTGTFNVKQEAGKARVEEVKLWTLDKLLGDVLRIGWQERV